MHGPTISQLAYLSTPHLLGLLQINTNTEYQTNINIQIKMMIGYAWRLNIDIIVSRIIYCTTFLVEKSLKHYWIKKYISIFFGVFPKL